MLQLRKTAEKLLLNQLKSRALSKIQVSQKQLDMIVTKKEAPQFGAIWLGRE